MDDLFLEARDLKKSFGGRSIFFDINFKLLTGRGMGIVGKNGAGKSTLAKIIASLLAPTEGEITLEVNGKRLAQERRYECIGFVAPYLQLYEEFSAWENLIFFRKIRGLSISNGNLLHLLKRVGLPSWESYAVRTLSSGMKQRLKYASALLHQPPILILDEPSSNLDAEGVDIVSEIMREQIKNGILIVATNDKKDLRFCNQIIDLDIYAMGRAEVKT